MEGRADRHEHDPARDAGGRDRGGEPSARQRSRRSMARAVHDVVPVVPQDAKPARPRGKHAGAGSPRAGARPAGSAEAIAARTDAAFAEATALRARADDAAAAAMAALRFTGEGTRGLTFERRWTRPGVHPYDEIPWEVRTAAIGNESGKLVFEQKDVEVPAFWSQLATNVVVSKYFRGHLNTPERETSVRQLIDRVVTTIAAWAETQHYFATKEDLATFQAELTHLLVHQKMSFNSPVWFNVGIEPRPQCSACQPWRALVSTPEGMIPIGRLVDERRDRPRGLRPERRDPDRRRQAQRTEAGPPDSPRERQLRGGHPGSRGEGRPGPPDGPRVAAGRPARSQACGCTCTPIERGSPPRPSSRLRSRQAQAPRRSSTGRWMGRPRSATRARSCAPRRRSPAGCRPTDTWASTTTGRTGR